jgi:hypothetical protein
MEAKIQNPFQYSDHCMISISTPNLSSGVQSRR